MKITQHADLATAIAHEEVNYVQINSNEAEQFFELAGQMENLEAAVTNETVVEIFPNMPTTVGRIAKAIISTMAKSDGKWTVDPRKEAGQLNRGAAWHLLNNGVLTQAVIDMFFKIGTRVTKPFANATQEDWDAEIALNAIVEQEVTYPSESYILTTGQQGIDIEINTDVDCTFTCYLAVCNDQANQNDSASYMRYNQAVGVAKSDNGKAIISLSNRKVRTFNRLYILPSAVCEFTATASSNRG